MTIIDVSEWQGVIEWEQVKPHIDGAILRAGWGAGNADRQFARNAAECNRLGIPCGAYWFSYASNPGMAAQEAGALIKAVQPYKMQLPLAFDYEYDSVRAAGGNVSLDMATQMLYAFCEAIEAAGYWCIVYTNPDFMARYFSPDVPKRFGLWLAQWPGGLPDLSKPPRPDVQLWQWTSKGSVPGIATDVDTNAAFVDFVKLIHENGMNHLDAKPEQQTDPTQEAMSWGKARGIIPDNVNSTTPVTWGDLAIMARHLHT